MQSESLKTVSAAGMSPIQRLLLAFIRKNEMERRARMRATSLVFRYSKAADGQAA